MIRKFGSLQQKGKWKLETHHLFLPYTNVLSLSHKVKNLLFLLFIFWSFPLTICPSETRTIPHSPISLWHQDQQQVYNRWSVGGCQMEGWVDGTASPRSEPLETHSPFLFLTCFLHFQSNLPLYQIGVIITYVICQDTRCKYVSDWEVTN